MLRGSSLLLPFQIETLVSIWGDAANRFLKTKSEPSEAGLILRGGAAEGASFRDASRKRDDPQLAPTTRPSSSAGRAPAF